MKTAIRILAVLVVLAGAVTLAPQAYTVPADLSVDFNRHTDTAVYPAIIEKGITINGIDMSGLTKEQAEGLLEDYYKKIETGVLSISAGSSYYSESYSNLGFKWDYSRELDSALLMGQSTGRTIKKFKALSDMHAGEMALDGSESFDSSKLRAFVKKLSDSCHTEPVDATLAREDGRFIVTRGRNGMRIDETKTYMAAAEILKELPEHARLKATITPVEQKVSYEMLSQVKDVLGTCTTKVAGTEARAHNVALGSSNINGLLLMPGESASASLLMEERTRENGYLMAAQYVDGRSEDTWGGGICQVSSTLYNALIMSEIQIDERHNHSMTVTYLEPSMDAAISWGSKDMRFTNNTEYPIYIEGWSKDRKCTFNIYGCETRPENRKIEYVSVIDEERHEPNNVIYSNEFPVGYTKTTGKNHPFVRSHMDKLVYVDGVLESRKTIHSDTYYSSVGTTIIGTNEAAQPTEGTPESAPAPGQ